MRSLVVCLLLAACVLECTARLQNITVKGVAVCNKKRLANVQIQLYEKDTLDPDDLLTTKNTDAEGEFSVYGEEDETHTIVPYLLVTHNCNPSKPNCVRIGKYLVPEDKIGGTYDMTYVTLDIKVHGEKEKCT
ncbi:Protein CBR-TTR-16 [Caenorhabditis briggsae]|uniref:Uncharacterized protein n=2 Tax=Caenorhabditis briggsae TaxID=6238 RepID=A0AAE9AB19_CAEBR|nr:Protein CBR-TTR-16 [Caenorhabditis briggsae]ULT95294.1 hypothetical protein L3Y34_004190 [Caenorhabditis briggsae]UMM28497.1 hypothetical protein L5515_011311 [Caenorhabditis briggsae]CAP26364.1 Protein CBR-TTR-16 [Caenorhabditis briggsae]